MISQNALQKKIGENWTRGKTAGIAADARLTNLLDLGDHGPSDLHCVQRGDRMQPQHDSFSRLFETF